MVRNRLVVGCEGDVRFEGKMSRYKSSMAKYKTLFFLLCLYNDDKGRRKGTKSQNCILLWRNIFPASRIACAKNNKIFSL